MRGLFIEVDLVQAEWVVVAYYSQDINMLEVIEKGLDPHVRTGQLISGAPKDLIVLDDQIVRHETDPEIISNLRRQLPTHWHDTPISNYFFPRTCSIRQAGKKSNHGLNYDEGYKRFALENEMPETDGMKCVANYHRGYPGIKRMHRSIKEQLRRDRTLRNCLGEKQEIHKALTDKVLRYAYSYVPQSTVGRVCNNGIRDTYRALKPPLVDVEPLANVHDSMLTQAWPRAADELLEIMYALDKVMTTQLCYHGQEFILRRSFKIGRNWGEDGMREVDLTPEAVEEAWDGIQKAE